MTPGRPKIPLLSRERIIKAALKIVDEEGLEALTTRRLAADLGVKGASLYNHFRDKDDIIVAVAEYALTRVPKRMLEKDVTPQQLLLWGVVALRDALLANPNLIPVLIRHPSLGIANREAVTARLIEGGIPVEDVLLLHESLERWAIGNAVREATDPAASSIDPEMTKVYPALSKAAERQRKSSHQMFETVAASIIESVLETAGASRSGAPSTDANADAASPRPRETAGDCTPATPGRRTPRRSTR
ncbi:TetR/AcrR family transcriptional regulator [Streptomyces sp. NPDC001292]|uniref:TetR/AcrR family transcriptional regulator n=1 Tax=Streptomyces sp. NPDC001292 TaxID=3364558 RepID=UPI0036B7F3D4